MTDVRRCDGPGCSKEAPLNKEETRSISELSAECFITLESFYHGNIHFHNDSCLRSWTAANTKAKGVL